MKLFVVFAMQRSGHHAVIHWLCCQHGDIKHINNVQLSPDGTTFSPPAIPDMVRCYGQTPQATLINLETLNLENDWQRLGWPQSAALKAYDAIQYVAVIRRFRNWLASSIVNDSQIVQYFNTPEAIQNFVTRQFPAYESYIKAAQGHRYFDNLITVRFDDWFASKDYRKQLAQSLGVTWTDAGLNTVLHHGGGSTFDHQTYDSRAQQMNVLRRYEQVQEQPLYRELLQKGQHLDQLSEELFGATG